MRKKYIYLLFLLIITLLGTVLSRSYAKFTSGFTTEEDVVGMTLSFNLGISTIEEYEEIRLDSGEYEIFNIEIENITNENIYYGLWYKMVLPLERTEDIIISKLEGTDISTSGSINSNETKTVSIIVINFSKDNIRINIGVGSSNTSTNDIEYLSGKYLITGEKSIPYLSSYIQDLYNDGSSLTTVNIGGDSNKPTVSQNANQSIMLDNNGEYRYYGANPNNYVSFNDELWRIISVSNVKDDEEDTEGSMRVKIIRDESIGNYSWDSSASTINYGYGINDWSKSDLMTELNTLYYNKQSGICYNGENNSSTTCDFTNSGINLTSKNLVDDALWYLGGSSVSENLYADDYYNFERGTVVWGTTSGQTCNDGACPRSVNWTGKVGLMYPSDYMYASDLNLCIKFGYNSSDYSLSYSDISCRDNNWLIMDINQWVLSPYTNLSRGMFALFSDGFLKEIGGAFDASSIRPTLYLRTDVLVAGGNGTVDDPYQINVKDNYLSNHVIDLYNSSGNLRTVNIGGDSSNPAVSQNTSQSIMLDNNGEYRYYGANPNNYVSFNDELWRIISVSNVKTSEEDIIGSMRVKIIRNNILGYYSWDSSASTINSGNGINDWSKSDLMMELNTLYYSKQVGDCYNDVNNVMTACDFTGNGLNEKSRKMIGDALYYLGAFNIDVANVKYANNYYNGERSLNVYSGNPVSWKGKIALMYPSDYAYATDLSLCTNAVGWGGTSDGYNQNSFCTDNDWLLYREVNTSEWTLIPFNDRGSNAFHINDLGYISGNYVSYPQRFRPVVYLKSNVVIVGGNGSKDNPYQLSIN